MQEMKSLGTGAAALKQCLLDPAVNLLFERLKRDLDTARAKMEETQNELAAWKFTPDRCDLNRMAYIYRTLKPARTQTTVQNQSCAYMNLDNQYLIRLSCYS